MCGKLRFKEACFALGVLIALTGCEDNNNYPPIAATRLETKASWSPDGSTIAYYRDRISPYDTTGIRLIDADGTNDRYLYPGLSADWSPDGKRLVVGTYSWEICIIDKDGSNVEWLITDGESNSPAWSPDGEKILFQMGLDTWVVDAN